VWAYALVGPRRFTKLEVPTPRVEDIQDGQVLLRPVVGGICGSDLPGFAGYQTPARDGVRLDVSLLPGFPLHEILGDVVVSRAPGLPEGTRVVGWGWNSLSEYVVGNSFELTAVDPDWDPAFAIMIQPLACVLYAVDQLERIDSAHVAVLGLGPIGLLFCHVLKHSGAGRVTGVDVVDRSGEADAFGIDDVVHATSRRWAGQLADAERPSTVVEAVGHQTATLLDAIHAVADSGLIYYFGIPDDQYTFDMYSFLRKNLTLKAGGTRSREQYLEKACQYFRKYPELAATYVTHVYDIDDLTAAFETASVPAPGRAKVALRFGPPGDGPD
jgi:L-iditol 2-dehydrogenase